MKRLQLSGSAVEDLIEIESYSRSQFGVRQTQTFLDQIEASLEIITSQPTMGCRRPEIDPPGHQFYYLAILKIFVVVYEVAPDAIRVARIIHGARNLLAELIRDSGGPEEST